MSIFAYQYERKLLPLNCNKSTIKHIFQKPWTTRKATTRWHTAQIEAT